MNELVDLKELNMTDEELFAPYDNSSVESEKITAPRYSYWKSVFRVFFKKKINIVILALLGLIVAFAYVYPAIIGYDVKVSPFINVADATTFHLDAGKAMERFGASIHWLLGTDSKGGSLFDAIWFGSSLSISLALICALINMVIGVILGAIWGFSKKFDLIMNEVYNIIGNVPYLLVIGVLIMIFKPTFWTLVFAMTLTGWLGIAYFIRTQVIIIRDREYNLASRCLGTNIFRLCLKNILPFMTSVIVTLLATEIPSYISYEVFLSYIGLGISDPTLGKIIEAGEKVMQVYPNEFWPSVAIASIITVVLYLVGQNLGDASDPRTHM